MGGRAEIFQAGSAARLRDCSIRIGGIEPRQAQQVAGAHRCRTEPHVLRRLVIDDLLSGFGAVANTEDVDLQDRLEESKTLGRNDGERTWMLAEMTVPGLSREVMRNSVCNLMSVPFQTALGGR